MNKEFNIITLGLMLGVMSLSISCKTSYSYSYEQEELPKFTADFRKQSISDKGDSNIKIVSFNIEFSKEIEGAIDLLKSGELADTDILLLQEMDEHGVDEIAQALSLQYIYCPSSNHPKEKTNLGNAVLTKGEIIQTEKKTPIPKCLSKAISIQELSI